MQWYQVLYVPLLLVIDFFFYLFYFNYCQVVVLTLCHSLPNQNELNIVTNKQCEVIGFYPSYHGPANHLNDVFIKNPFLKAGRTLCLFLYHTTIKFKCESFCLYNQHDIINTQERHEVFIQTSLVYLGHTSQPSFLCLYSTPFTQVKGTLYLINTKKKIFFHNMIQY